LSHIQRDVLTAVRKAAAKTLPSSSSLANKRPNHSAHTLSPTAMLVLLDPPLRLGVVKRLVEEAFGGAIEVWLTRKGLKGPQVLD